MLSAELPGPNLNILVQNPERLFSLLAEFQNTDNQQIACIIDYDGTVSPTTSNSWDLVSLTDPNWSERAKALRRAYQDHEITETEFWQSSIDGLKENGFQGSVHLLTDACLPTRTGVGKLLENCSQFGSTIVYSAGIGEVIDIHIRKLAEIFGTKTPTIIANQIDNGELITSGNKNGTTLSQKLTQRGYSLDNITHCILIGDSLSDVDMCKGLNLQSVLKIGLLSNSKLQNPQTMQAYQETFDIVIVSDDTLEPANDYIEVIL